MDKKTKINFSGWLVTVALFFGVFPIMAQDVSKVQFCDRNYTYKAGSDSITVYFNLLDAAGKRVKDVPEASLRNYLVIKEDGKYIPAGRTLVSTVNAGQRIPSGYTFSVLVDLSIPSEGKEQIYQAIGKLVECAPDSSVYLSFFGSDVAESRVLTRQNYADFKTAFAATSDSKVFYSALYAKLVEFNAGPGSFEGMARVRAGYHRVGEIARRAGQNREQNVLIVFTEGTTRPDDEDITFVEVVDYQTAASHVVPRVMALYYTQAGEDLSIERTLKGICTPKDPSGNTLQDRVGEYLPSNDFNQILRSFERVIDDAMYDYAFTYKVPDGKTYAKTVAYEAEWKGALVGEGSFSIGTAERPWPVRSENAVDTVVKLLYALMVTVLTIAFFFFVAKVCIPYVRSRSFAMKYYKKYVQEANVQRRICHYCKQDIQPGQMVVTKCRHIMHVHCWKQNGYKCAEYGQNCKTGIQSHVNWKELFTMASLRDCYQAISGIFAGFVSWVVYELGGRGMFDALSARVAGWFLSDESAQGILMTECVNKISAFLTIGLLLGFFLSLTFRFNDEYRKKDMKTWLKIIGLSILTAFVGMLAFAVGANILCLLLTAIKLTYIPWYCSLPAYLLFSVCVSLALTIMSTIPVRSAMWGGLCSALIGFVVLYCSGESNSQHGWLHMLLNFVIYGGGLGASLVTVRMLAEKYFLVIQNGIKAGLRIPIHKWMNATGGGNKVSIGMTGECEIQMNWEKSNKVAKEHAQLFIDHEKQLPMLKPLATGVIFNSRAELPVGKPVVLSNGDTFKIGETTFQYTETE